MSATTATPLTKRGIPLDPMLRILALGQFANRFGAGAVMTTSALYFTRHAGFTPKEVAFALSAAALVGLLVQVPAGHLADTRGPTTMLAALVAGCAVTAVPPAYATTPLILAVLLALNGVFLSAAGAVNQGVIAQIATGGRGVLFKAYLRAVTNVAIGLGSLLGGVALMVDEPWAYISVFWLQGAMAAFAAWNTTRLPRLPAYVRPAGEPRLAVLRDLPYAAVCLVTTLFVVHFFVIELGLVLYISEHTEAPTVMVAILLVLNTAMVALLQVRLSRGVDRVADGARALVRGGWLIAAGFAVFALAQNAPMIAAIGVLVLGSVLHAFGEIIGSGGQWSLQMGLAPHERQGQYQGFASMSFGLARVIGPPVATFFCVDLGAVGWLILAGLTLAVAYSAIPVSRWALASRERYGVTSHSG